jgi:RNA polymerase sigma factor (sigma-70 family)
VRDCNNRLVSGYEYEYDCVMDTRSSSSVAPRVFPNTRWSVVLAARQQSPDASAALEIICQSYWYPLYAYIRRCGHAPHDAQDLTQAFFCRLLEKRLLDFADREKGKLRSFLITSLKNFISNEWRRAATLRRGGGQSPTPFDTAFAESRIAADNQSLGPDETYDQQWAFTLLDLTLKRLQAEFAAAGKPNEFAALKECLMAARGGIDYAAISKNLRVNEGAARVAVHRLRKRFREIYREEISQTLAEGADVEAELRHLADALAR